MKQIIILFPHCNVLPQYFNLLIALLSPVQVLQYTFLRAAHKGDLDKVKDLIGQGCPVYTTDQVKFALAQIHCKTYIEHT